MRIFVVLMFLFSTLSFAQSVEIGVILSLTGEHAASGQADLKGVESFKAQLSSTGFSSDYFEILIKDDGSSVALAETLAEQFIAEGVHALLCCRSAQASKRVLALSQQANVLTLALSELPSDAAWGYSFEPSAERVIQALFLAMAARGENKVAVMTPDNAIGDLVERAVRRLSVPGGVGVIELMRYPPEATVLTPEALWVATRLPDVILVWGGVQDSILAYQSLRERGFEKQIIVPPALLLRDDYAQEVIGAFSLLPNLEKESSIVNDGSEVALARYKSFYEQQNGDLTQWRQAAASYDALSLLNQTSLTVLSIGIGDNTPALRSAMNETFSSLGVVTGVNATYDFGLSREGIRANSLSMQRANPINP